MIEAKESMDWPVCGRMIGQASGWDQADTLSIQLYDFVPGTGYVGPVGDVCINFEDGTIQSFDDEGKTIQSVDLLDAIQGCPRHIS